MVVGYFAAALSGWLVGNALLYGAAKQDLETTRPDMGETTKIGHGLEQLRNEHPIVYYLSGRLGVKHALRKYQRSLGF
jgi:hypothetical protein